HIRRLRIREQDDGSYALYSRDPDLEEGTEPRGIVAKNEGSFALMAAGVLPLLAEGRSYWMRASQTSDPGKEICRYGHAIANLRFTDDEALTIFNFCDVLVRSPECLAAILESSGARVLRIIGKIIARRLGVWLADRASWLAKRAARK
ncbi:MAG: hypothetical protein GY723_14165, partial [bacterium]|nr:hypothetical protein [bacterium]